MSKSYLRYRHRKKMDKNTLKSMKVKGRLFFNFCPFFVSAIGM